MTDPIAAHFEATSVDFFTFVGRSIMHTETYNVPPDPALQCFM
jgi:hypothetical protein